MFFSVFFWRNVLISYITGCELTGVWFRETSERSTDEAIDVLAESAGYSVEELVESEAKVHV